MSSQTLGIIIGGLIPGMVFGISNVVVKLTMQKGIALPLYVVVTGIAVVCVGVVLLFLFPERNINMTSASIAFSGGALWACGMTCLMFALHRYNASISVLTPLFNMNTLIAVILGMWLFAEWKTVQVPQLLIGSVLIVIGGTLVARA